MLTYIRRSLEPVLERAAREFPAVVLIGPRQSGKTTLLNQLFRDRLKIISLESPDVRLAATNDPRGFLSLYPAPVIFDEIQYVPDLLPYIKEQIDANRDVPGQYILTGSQNFFLMETVTESLAGRAAILKLLPLSRWEAAGVPDRVLPWESGALSSLPEQTSIEVWTQALRGYYPEIALAHNRDIQLWQASYVQTYLERDVRNLKNIGDLTRFQTFLRALAARSAQILNLSELARDIGITVNTAKAWLAILEASFQIFLLKPFHANIGKRLIKSPKLYFMDTGLLCYLVGFRDVEHAILSPMSGAIFENLVIADLHKIFLHRGIEPPLYYWRTVAGAEVDVVVEKQNQLIPIEIKASETPRPALVKGIIHFRQDLGDQAQPGYLVYPGKLVLPMGAGVTSLPLNNL